LQIRSQFGVKCAPQSGLLTATLTAAGTASINAADNEGKEVSEQKEQNERDE